MKKTFYFILSFLTFAFWILPFNVAEAALILQAPKYIGLNSDLVGYWSFNSPDMAGNIAYDRSGNSNNGTLTGGPVRAIGKLGQALSFDGSNDYVNDASSNTSNAYTYTQWVRPSDAMSSVATFQSIRNASSNRLWSYYQDVDRIIVVQYQNTVPTTVSLAFTTTVTLNTWQHIAISANLTTGVVNLFKNGSFVETGTLTNAGSVPTFTLHRIGSNSLSDDFFLGLIDDVRVYNRALSADEIKRLYRIGATLKVNTDVSRDNPDLERGLVGLWSFDGKDMAGVTAYDRSGNANNGTLTNGPTRAIGKLGQALSFDGSNDYVNDASSNTSNAYTYTQWVRPSDAMSSVATFQSIRNASSNRLWSYYQDVDRIIVVQYQNTVPTTVTLAFTTTVTLNTWQHIAISANLTTGVVNLFKNGSFVETGTLTNAGNVPTFTIHRIGSNSLSDDFFNGLIDDVRVYNRTLTPAEIQRLYNLGR